MIESPDPRYKILDKLGEGGMGVVYKAHDTTLDRVVALKFLPHHLNVTEEEKARFLQEAKAAATLNHPNICVIHDIKEEGGKNFIVMEFIDGVTLHEKFGKMPVPFKEAVGYAIQVGGALEEAHTKGIVHRDIKADNIMLNDKGQIKVMDFGLAKLKGSLRITKATSTVGTLGYMAPEQIQGGETDARADIFSFGVVLFELLTGKLPFRGEHEAAIMYSVLNEEPESLQKTLPDVSSELVHVVTTALEKDPNDRYQSVSEMLRDLRRLVRQSSRVSHTRYEPGATPSSPGMRPPSDSAMPSPSIPQNRFGGMNKWIIAGAGVLILGALAFVFLRNSAPRLNPNMTFRTISMPYTDFQYPGLSKDGNWIVFPAADQNKKWDLYWMHKSGGDARRVTFDSSVAPPARFLIAMISPDGSQIAYNRTPQVGALPELAVVSSNGGVGRKVASFALGARWNPDGSRIAFITVYPGPTRRIGVNSVKPDGTDERVEFLDSATVQGNISFAFSPDGQSMAWIRGFKGGVGEIITINLKTRQERQLTNDGKQLDDVSWTDQGTIFFSSTKSGNTNLWMIPATGGEEVQVTKGSGPDLGIQVSADGKSLLYYQNQSVGNIWLSDNQGANMRQLTSDDRSIQSVALSPDGRTVAFAMSESDAGFTVSEFHLFLMDRDGTNRRQITFGKEVVGPVKFSPDGTRLAYASLGLGESRDSIKVRVIQVNGSGSPVALMTAQSFVWTSATELNIISGAASYKVSATGGPATRSFQDSVIAPQFDKLKLNFFVDMRAASMGLWTGVPGSKSARRIIPNRTNFLPDPASRSAYYIAKDRTLHRVSLVDGKEEQVRGLLSGINNIALLGPGNAGKEIAFIRRQSRGKLVMIENLIE